MLEPAQQKNDTSELLLEDGMFGMFADRQTEAERNIKWTPRQQALRQAGIQDHKRRDRQAILKTAGLECCFVGVTHPSLLTLRGRRRRMQVREEKKEIC